MKRLFVLLSGFLICAVGASDEVTTGIGENIDLKCLGTIATNNIFKIKWSTANDRLLYICFGNECEVNGTLHSLGRGERFLSILHVQNVTLKDEDEYFSEIGTTRNARKCNITLVVNVPPTGLSLIDEDDGNMLPSNGSLIVPEGVNKTIVCKTSTLVKPAVDLEWVIPEGLNKISEYGDQWKDKQDERLFVSRRKLIFSPTYKFRKDIPLGCKVVNNPSFQHIRTSIYIKEGAITTTAENPRIGSEENLGFTGGAGTLKGSDALSTSFSSTSTKEIALTTPYAKNQLYIIAGGSGAVIMLLLVAVVGGVIVSKKIAVKRSPEDDSTEDAPRSRPSESRGALPPPPSDQSFLNANHLPDRQPSPARSFRPAPPIPSDIPMRQMVPVSDDTTGSTSENNRLREATSRGASATSPATQSQRGIDTDTEYDVLNDMEYDVLNMEHVVVDKIPSKATGAVPHVYRETSDGLAEYALVSRPKMGKNALQPRFLSTEQLDAEFEYAVVDKSHRTGSESVPHVYTQTMSGLEEYAVVNKPKDRKKRQSEVRHTTAPGDFEAEYAVVDKWKKN